jgi:hypothetical protein
VKWISEFFRDIDRGCAGAPKVRLGVIGSAALMLQTSYVRATKDSDVLETAAVTAVVRERLLRLAGPGTELAKKSGLYLDIVRNGLPFLPHVPRWHSLDDLNADLVSLEVQVLDPVDVAVSKLKRFHANDVADISAMVERDLVTHESLVERFREAVDMCAMTAYADDLPQYVSALHRVERDMFGVKESEIDLPDWV